MTLVLLVEDDLDLACRTLTLGHNKVCGLTRIEDLIEVAQKGAVYGGLIFAQKSPRAVTKAQALELVTAFNATTYKLNLVGVFVNENSDEIAAIAKQLGNLISLNEANDKLAEAKQFDAFNQMSAFLVHDLKNIQAQLALINSNAKRHRDNPAFVDDVFETVESATQRLDKVLSQLRKKQQEHSSHSQEDLLTIINSPNITGRITI